MALRSSFANNTPNLGRTSERDLIHIGMFDQRLARASIACHNVDHPCRQPDLATDIRESQRGQWSKFRWLQHNCVAGRQSRRDLPRQH